MDPHAARQLANGRWLFVCRGNGRLLPLGYCSERCRHASQREAEAHYLEYLADTADLGGRWAGKDYRCEACGEWTERYAALECGVVLPLCGAHLDRAALGRLIQRLGVELVASSSSPPAASKAEGGGVYL